MYTPFSGQRFIQNMPYMCHTGVVISMKDGDEHIVRAGQLPALYKVPKKMCIMIDNMQELHGWSEDQLNRLIHLFPRTDGDYSKIPQPGVIEND